MYAYYKIMLDMFRIANYQTSLIVFTVCSIWIMYYFAKLLTFHTTDWFSNAFYLFTAYLTYLIELAKVLMQFKIIKKRSVKNI